VWDRENPASRDSETDFLEMVWMAPTLSKFLRRVANAWRVALLLPFLLCAVSCASASYSGPIELHLGRGPGDAADGRTIFVADKPHDVLIVVRPDEEPIVLTLDGREVTVGFRSGPHVIAERVRHVAVRAHTDKSAGLLLWLYVRP